MKNIKNKNNKLIMFVKNILVKQNVHCYIFKNKKTILPQQSKFLNAYIPNINGISRDEMTR